MRTEGKGNMNKNVLVTGGTNGLGLSIARKHLELGDRVWAVGTKSNPEIETLLRERREADLVLCDISKTENVQRALAPLVPQLGKLDYLYNSAGIYRFEDKKPLQETLLDNAASMFDINAVGFLRVVQALLPAFGDGSVIVCVSSEAGSLGQCERTAEYNYCMSKAAANMACVILQNHFDQIPQATRVLSVHPGWLRTRMGGELAFQQTWRSVAPQDSAEAIVNIALDIDNIPKERMYMDYKRNPIAW